MPYWFETDRAEREPVAAKFDAAPIACWNLLTRTRNSLLQADPRMTVGDVIRAGPEIGTTRNIGPGTLGEIERHVLILLADPDGPVAEALLTAARQLKAAGGPKPREETWEPGGTPECITPELAGRMLATATQVIKTVLLEGKGERIWNVIAHRYGLAGARRMTYRALGKQLGVACERVRQMEFAALHVLYHALVHRRPTRTGYVVPAEMTAAIRTLYQLIGSHKPRVLLETELFDHLRATFAVDPAEHRPLLAFLLALIHVTRIDFGEAGLVPVWAQLDKPARDVLVTTVKRLHTLLTEETGLPLSPAAIAQRLGEVTDLQTPLPLVVAAYAHYMREEPNSNGLPLPAQVYLAINYCSSVERREDGTVWGRFAALSRPALQAERVLYLAGAPLRLDAILHEIRRRLPDQAGPPLDVRGLRKRLYRDPRFAAGGRSGKWKLAEWGDSPGVVTLIEEYLQARNTPATILELRSALALSCAESTIRNYLADARRFRKMGQGTWGLASWPAPTIWDPARVADFVAALFEREGVPALELWKVQRALVDAANLTGRQAYSRIKSNPALERRDEGFPPRAIITLQPNYRERFNRPRRVGRPRRRPVQEQIAAAVRELLAAAPGHQMPTPVLIAHLIDRFGDKRESFYYHLAHLDFVERVVGPGRSASHTRLKDVPEQ